MRRAHWFAMGGSIASLLVGCVADDNATPSSGLADSSAPIVDATTGPVSDASGSHDAGPIVDSTVPEDAAEASVPVDANDASQPIDANDASDAGIDATDAADSAPDFDAFTFPDAQTLTGLRIGFLGNAGNASESLLQAYLTSGCTVTRIENGSDNSALDGTVLANFDVVVLDSLIRSYTQAEAQALSDWVAAGGGVLSLTGFSGSGTDGTNPNSLLSVIGVQYVTGAIYNNFTTIPVVAHPVMTGVDHLKFAGGYPVTTIADAGVDAGSDVVIAMIDGTHVALLAREIGSGRVLAWGDEWIEYDSEFTNNQGTERFWNNAMEWLTHEPIH